MNKQFCQPINKLRLFWLISFLFILSGCFKEKFPKDSLNTLSNQLICRVTGNIWESNELEFYSGFYNDHLYLRYSDGTSSSFVFIINPPYHQGSLILNHNTNSYPNIVDPQDYAGYEIWYPDLRTEEIRTEEIYITNATTQVK